MDPPTAATPRRHKSTWKTLIQRTPGHSRSTSRGDDASWQLAASQSSPAAALQPTQRQQRVRHTRRPQDSHDRQQESTLQSFRVEHIFLAEFDIDKGSVIRYQYPLNQSSNGGRGSHEKNSGETHSGTGSIPINEHGFPFHYTEQEIAAQMLPDGSHNTAEDVTYFFLRKNLRKWRETQIKRRQEAVEKYGITEQQQQQQQEQQTQDDIDLVYLSDEYDFEDHDDDDNQSKQPDDFRYSETREHRIRQRKEAIWNAMHDGPDFLYCLNVYKMKQVKGVRRNARVKALTVASTESSIFALKPLLSHALDRIFQVDKSAQMQEAHVEREHKLQSSTTGPMRNESESGNIGSHSMKRPAVDDGIAQHVDGSEDTPERIIQQLYKYINSINLEMHPRLREYEKIVWRFTLADPSHTSVKLESSMFAAHKIDRDNNSTSDTPKQHIHLTNHHAGVSLQMTLPLALTENEVNDSRVSLVNLVDKLREKVMVLFNAVLYEKRVMFLGYNLPAGDVCCYTMSACLLVPMLSQLLQRRVYPYCSLSDLEFLEERGFIAGACNPMFKSKAEWWDCLVDLNSGEVIVSDSSPSLSVSTTVVDGFELFDPLVVDFIPDSQISDDIRFMVDEDNAFIQRILQLVAFHRKRGTDAPILEDLVRSHFRDYAQCIFDMAADHKQSKLTPRTPPSTPLSQSADNYDNDNDSELFFRSESGLHSGENSPTSHSSSFDPYFDTAPNERKQTPQPKQQQQQQQVRRIRALTSKVQRLTPRKLRAVHRQDTSKIVTLSSLASSSTTTTTTTTTTAAGLSGGSASTVTLTTASGGDDEHDNRETMAASVAAHGSGIAIKSMRLYKTRHFKQHLLFIENASIDMPIAHDAQIYRALRVLRTTGVYNGTAQSDTLPETELISILQSLNKHVRTEDQLMEFLSYLPHTLGGLYPVAILLMHPSVAIRLLVVAFLRRLGKTRVGELALEKLNTFLLLAYERNSSLLPDTAS